jgi:hypothetical protein
MKQAGRSRRFAPDARHGSPAAQRPVFLFAAQSALGVTLRTLVYPTADLYGAFVPNDYINLFFGVPCLIVSLALALRNARLGFHRRGRLPAVYPVQQRRYLFASQGFLQPDAERPTLQRCA